MDRRFAVWTTQWRDCSPSNSPHLFFSWILLKRPLRDSQQAISFELSFLSFLWWKRLPLPLLRFILLHPLQHYISFRVPPRRFTINNSSGMLRLKMSPPFLRPSFLSFLYFVIRLHWREYNFSYLFHFRTQNKRESHTNTQQNEVFFFHS